MSDYRIEVNLPGKENTFSTNIDSCQITSDYDNHHRFTIESTYEVEEAITCHDISSLLGEAISIKFCKGGQQGVFKGVIDAAKISSNTNGEKTLQISGYSPTILLDCGQPVKGYANKSLDYVVKQTLTGSKVKCEIASDVGQEQLPWVLQYFESNYNFLKRLADASGKFEFYYDGEKCFFEDITKQSSSKPIELIEGQNLKKLKISFDIAPQRYSIKAYKSLNKQSLTANPQPVNTRSELLKIVLDKSELFDEEHIFLGYAIQEQNEIDRMDKRIRASQTNELLVITGLTDDPRIRVGSPIEIETANGVLDGELSSQFFTVIRVEHHYSDRGSYTNRFVAVISGLPLNLRMTYETPKLPPTGAVVTDIDPAKGLLKVQLFCDQNQVKTPWLRFLTPFSGSGGFFLPPKVGDHVMVMGEDMNVNSIFVLGAFYAGDEAQNWQKGKVGFYADDKSGILFEEGEVIFFGEGIRLVSRQESSWDASELYFACNKGTMPTKR